MKGRVLESTKRHIDKLNKDVYDVSVESEGKTTKYQCWSAHIAELHGKEIEFTVKPAPEGTTFLPTLELPRGDGNTFQKGKGFAPRTTSPEQLETMILSYKKDVMLACLNHAASIVSMKGETPSVKVVSDNALELYRKIGYPLFHKEKTPTPDDVAKTMGGKVVDDKEIPF